MARGKKTEKELQEKKERALALIEGLKKGYPDSGCSLIYEKDQAWKLLVSVRLAAQCTDARVNVVVKGLLRTSHTIRQTLRSWSSQVSHSTER